MLVEITKCSDEKHIGFQGQLTTKEVWCKRTFPDCWLEMLEIIQPNQVCIIGVDESFVSDPHGFVEYIEVE